MGVTYRTIPSKEQVAQQINAWRRKEDYLSQPLHNSIYTAHLYDTGLAMFAEDDVITMNPTNSKPPFRTDPIDARTGICAKFCRM